jgi:vanillate O-demethylase ferredoxin subunit
MNVIVRQRKQETDSISVFELVDADGKDLPAFTAGAHIDVHLPSGLMRQYSLCNPASETGRYQIGVLNELESRGGSKDMHENVREGDVLTISEPRNQFELCPVAEKSLLLAGGIGVTPLLCMAETLSDQKAEFEMHYCTRTKKSTAFMDRLNRSRYASRVFHHFDDGGEDQSFDMKAVLSKFDDTKHLYVCGPQGFMDAILNTARQIGWKEDNLHYEFFSAQDLSEDGDAAFDLELRKTGKIITVAKDQTVVEALEAIGIEIEVSCEQGLCGTCELRVVAGTPDHRDVYLTAEEQALNQTFMPCCSRSKTPKLIVDL